MSKATTVQAPSPLRAFWLKWRFHINILLLLVPLGFMPKYFADAALFRGRRPGRARDRRGAGRPMEHHPG